MRVSTIVICALALLLTTAVLTRPSADAHLYLNHMTQVNQLLGRDPLPLPTVLLTYEPSRRFEEIEPEEISVVGYAPHPAIPAPVAV